MGMSIDEIIQGLKETIIVCNSVFAYDRKKYIDVAIDTMRKYEKIVEIVKSWRENGLDYDSCDAMDNIERVLEDGNDD